MSQIKVLEEKMERLVEENNKLEKDGERIRQENQDYICKIQKSSLDHTSQIELLNAQLKQYESDFHKERDQRERLVVAYDMVEKRLCGANDEKKSLQQEINSLVARLMEVGHTSMCF